jgi:short-subunit dehydrogenase
MKTALITGASSGIGLEFARIFAAHKNNLVLVARSGDKLNALAAELKEKHAVEVKIIAADLSDIAQVQQVYDTCQSENIEVEYLINNAGFGDFKNFANENWDTIMGMIDLNIKALTKLTHLFVPDMVKRKSGKILNVASTAAFQPGPGMAIYFATKSFVLFLSEALHVELKYTGVNVTCLCPGPTESGFATAAAMENANIFTKGKIPTSKKVAEYGYKALMKNKMTVIHGLLNTIMATAERFVPRSLVVSIAKKVNGEPGK